LVEKAADVLAHECNDLMVLWLADKIKGLIGNEMSQWLAGLRNY
jgi:hypothetical protein